MFPTFFSPAVTLVDILWQLHRYSVELSHGRREKRERFSTYSYFVCSGFVSSLLAPGFSLSPCAATSWHWPCPFSPGFLSFLMHIFKFRKAELKPVFWGKKVLYFHNCMLSIFNAIFGLHNLFVWFCWHVLFWLLRQRGQKFPVSYPLWRWSLSWAVSQCRT